MKHFVFAILAAVAVLMLVVALLWPPSPAPHAKRVERAWPAASTVETPKLEPSYEPYEVPAVPPPSDVFEDAATPFDEPTIEIPPSDEASTKTANNATAGELRQQAETNEPIEVKISPEEQLTLEQTAKSSTSLRNADFPRTYISSIRVDLTSPNHWVRLTWTGPQARSQETGPFHSSPGRGLGNNNCDDVAESNRDGSNCTPKGTMQVQGFSDSMRTCAQCRFVTWFQIPRGVAFHYYPDVPNYPASHGCVRLEEMRAAQLIHNNSKIGATEVIVDGKWKFGR